LDEKQEAHLIEENLFLQQRSQELETLFKISGLLNQQGTYKDKLNGVIKELALVAEVSGVRIVVPDPEHGGLRTIIREVGSTLPELQQVRGLSLMAFESGQAVVANDYPSQPQCRSSCPGNWGEIGDCVAYQERRRDDRGGRYHFPGD
jgi:hypothetical protein